jgi:hypothetical protein
MTLCAKAQMEGKKEKGSGVIYWKKKDHVNA